MSWFLPTTTVTITRGSRVDSFGDEVDGNQAVASEFPCAIAQGSGPFADQSVGRPADARTTVVESYTLRFRPNVRIKEQDRVTDERFGLIYQVVSVFNPQSVVGAADVRAIALRVGAVSQPVNG